MHLCRSAAAVPDWDARRWRRLRASVEKPDGEGREQGVRQRLMALRGSDERQAMSDKHFSQRRWHQYIIIAQEHIRHCSCRAGHCYARSQPTSGR